LRVELPPPLAEAPPPRSAWVDFKLLFAAQLRVTWNKLRHWPPLTRILTVCGGIGLLSLVVYLGTVAYGALGTMDPEVARGFLSLLFMAGLAAQVFFGVTAAFAALYMSDDLELLFMAPVSTRAVFAVKSLAAAGSSFLAVALFFLLPGLFYGLLFSAGAFFYLVVALAGAGLWAAGSALAGLLNLLVMRVVPPHRSREAVGLIGAVAGVMIALLFQIPNLVMARGESLDIGVWLAAQDRLLRVMDYFPWGWGSLALAGAAAGNHLAGLGWSLLLLALGAALFGVSFLLVERGFRRGWISLSQGEGGRRRKKRRGTATPAGDRVRRRDRSILAAANGEVPADSASAWRGMWAVARKDLIYMRRDTREWFGYMIPLVIVVFFVLQYLVLSLEAAQAPLGPILFIYTIMFSGNMALQSFGREGESDWILNSVPLAGWPVAWGKLLAVVLPTLVLMEALLAGTAIVLGLSPSVILGMAVGAVLISLGASSMGLYYSINNCRYNPESPEMRVSLGAAMLMYLLNLLFALLLGLGVIYLFPPAELLAVLPEIPRIPFKWGFPDTLLYFAYLLSRPMLWHPVLRVSSGVGVAGGIWAAAFFGFMAATVRQSRKGFRVEIVTTKRKKPARGRLNRV